MLSLLKKNKNELNVDYQSIYASSRISQYLNELITENTATICIGTDRCIVDCLGPLVGTMLIENNICIDVYGTLENPVHGANIEERLKKIKNKNYEKIIAIDACLSNKKNIGTITVEESFLTPGKGIGKILPTIGDISIVGIVETSEKDFEELIHEMRLSTVYKMADVISRGILNAVNYKNNILEEVAYE